VVRHQAVLLELMGLRQRRLPSYSTLRRVMVWIDFRTFAQAFNGWAKATFAPQRDEQLATDGKGIKASVKDYDRSYQDFISVVSAFSVEQGLVVGLEAMSNGQQSEIVTVQTLLEALGLQDVCFTMDALHTQKKQLNKSSRMAMTISSRSKPINRNCLSISTSSLTSRYLRAWKPRWNRRETAPPNAR
jgi:hypothetical protein